MGVAFREYTPEEVPPQILEAARWGITWASADLGLAPLPCARFFGPALPWDIANSRGALRGDPVARYLRIVLEELPHILGLASAGRFLEWPEDTTWIRTGLSATSTALVAIHECAHVRQLRDCRSAHPMTAEEEAEADAFMWAAAKRNGFTARALGLARRELG